VTARVDTLYGELNAFNNGVVRSHIKWMEDRIGEARQLASGQQQTYLNDLSNVVELTRRGMRECEEQVYQRLNQFADLWPKLESF
jgi:hypothetical protein